MNSEELEEKLEEMDENDEWMPEDELEKKIISTRNILTKEQYGKIYFRAYEKAHPYGQADILDEFEDLAKFVEGLIKK